jgi:hypothetical protein
MSGHTITLGKEQANFLSHVAADESKPPQIWFYLHG